MNTQRTSGGSVTEGLPRKTFRLIDPNGKEYAPFRPKPGPALGLIAKSAPDCMVVAVLRPLIKG